ncbi:MAG TPA: hypothetical protein VFJ82_08190 [Longimicrobium sp.]|nr:hypothetical protein [Longimicrobium sp.]
MNRVIIVALALVVAPGVAFAQQVPQPFPRPLPGVDSLGVPPVVLVGITDNDPAQAALIGALEGAATGAAYAAALAERRPDCAPIASPGPAAAEGAVFGGLVGGLRGLLFRRQARVPSVLVNERIPQAAPRPDPNRPPAPLDGDRCMALAANSPAGQRR